MNKTLSLLAIVCMFFLLPAAYGQLPNCIGFSGLEEGATYEVADEVFYRERDVDLSLDSFRYLNGSMDLSYTEAGESFFEPLNWPGAGMHLFVSNANVVFDFSSYPGGVDFLCINFYDGGGQVNVNVNGVWQAFEDFPEGGWFFSDGIFIDIGNNTLCVNSDVPITEFAIGGQEFIIDNLCFSPLPAPPGCLGLDDESTLFESAAAQFFPNGLPYYSEDGVIFSLNRTFTNLQDITPNGHVLRSEAASFPAFNSASGLFLQHILSLSNIDLTAWVQAGQSVSFDYFTGSIATPVPPHFYIKVNNSDIRLTISATQTFSLGNFIVSVELLPGLPGNGRVTISPFTPTARIERLVVGGPALAIDNLCSANCAIGQAQAVQYVCDGNRFAATVGYSGDLPGNSPVQIFLNDTLYVGPNNTNSFLSNSFPRRIVLPAHYAAGDTVWVRLQNSTFEGCSTDAFGLVLVGCDAVCDSFSVTPLSAALTVASALDVEFTTTAQPLGQIIRARQLGANEQGGIGYIPPADSLEVTVPVASSELANPYTLVFEDGSTGCLDTVSIEAVYDCLIEDFIIEVDCESDGSFFINLNLFYNSPAPSLNFVAQAGSALFEFSSDELPVRLGPFAPVNAGITLDITDADGLCNTQSIFMPYDCGSQNCPLQSAQAEVVECLNTGYQAVLVTQLLAASPNTMLRIRSTVSNTVVELPYLPQLVVNMPYTGLGYDRWEVCVAGLPDCCRIVEFSLAECQESQCDITSINGELGCDPDGSGYRLFLNFAVTQPGNDFFDLFINGQPRGFYPLGQLPLALEDVELPANAETATVRVCINDMPNCCAELVVDVPGCNNQPCGFNDLIVEPYACDGELFRVDVAFNNPAPGALGFYIFADGNINGPFAYGQPFYTVGPLNGNNANHTFLLLDIANPACYASTTLTYSCSDDCVITAVTAEAQPCEDGFFSVVLNVEANNEGETFIVVGNGNNYGVFNYADLPITLGPFNGEDGPDVYEFGVTDLQNPGCTNWTAIGAPNCAPCSISNLSVEVNCEATDTGDPAITINFDYENPAGDHFALTFDGVTYEWFPYGALPLTLTMPAHFLDEVTLVGVYDLQQESCGQTIELEIPCCSLNWPVLGVRTGDCAEDGTFNIWVGGANTPNYGFNLSDSLVITYAPAGATLVETVTTAYSDLPIALGPLNGNGLTPYYVTLTDQSGGCSNAFGLSPVNCDDVNCIEFSELDGIYGPATGYESGDIIHLENGVAFTYEDMLVPISIPPGNIFGLSNTILPGAGGFGEGQIMALQNAAFGADFSQAAEFTGFQVEFYYTGGQVALTVNGSALHFVPTLSQLPTEPAPGVTLSILFSNNSSSRGVLRMEGPIETFRLYTLQTSAWDELCMDWVGEPVSNQCLTFEGIEGHVDSTNLVGFNDTNTGVFYEEGIVSLSTAAYINHLGVPVYGNLALVASSQNSNSNTLLAVNRNIVFDFPALGANGRLSLRFSSSYGVNAGFNNQAPVFYEHISDLPESPIPGVQVTVLNSPTPGGLEVGVIIIEGDLSRLVIGAEELFVWDICLDYGPGHEEVWPGDANLDNQASHFDLLNVGLAYDAGGPTRNSGNTEWNAQLAQAWNLTFADGVNYKHADCNGDGVVNAADRQVIIDNYGLTHGPVVPFEPLPATDLDPPVFISTGQVDTLPAGAVFEIPIHIGTADHPVENIYGLAFEVTLDPSLIRLEDLELVIPTSWMGEPGVNLLHLNYRYNAEGKLEIALVRTDHNNVSGYGPVAYLRGIIDDIVGIEETSIGIEKIKAIDAEGAGIPLRNLQTTVVLTTVNGRIDGQILESSFGIFPNPTNGLVQFRNAYDLAAERIEVYDAAGRMVSDQRGVFHQLSVANLPAGVYMLQLQVGGYRFCRRLVKMD